jgi:hypothetical protein
VESSTDHRPGAAQPRFSQISCQSAAKTATAVSPSLLRTRCTPEGLIGDLADAWRDKTDLTVEMVALGIR